MERDSIDAIVQAWRVRDPDLDTATLEVVGRLLLCATYFERVAGVALEPFGLTIADFDVINTLRRVGRRQGSKPTDLARSSMITTGAMTSRLDRLERAGLIVRAADPEDRRGVLVRLTPKGSRVATKAVHELIAANEEFLEPLDEPQRQALASGLRQLLLGQETG